MMRDDKPQQDIQDLIQVSSYYTQTEHKIITYSRCQIFSGREWMDDNNTA